MKKCTEDQLMDLAYALDHITEDCENCVRLFEDDDPSNVCRRLYPKSSCAESICKYAARVIRTIVRNENGRKKMPTYEDAIEAWNTRIQEPVSCVARQDEDNDYRTCEYDDCGYEYDNPDYY